MSEPELISCHNMQTRVLQNTSILYKYSSEMNRAYQS